MAGKFLPCLQIHLARTEKIISGSLDYCYFTCTVRALFPTPPEPSTAILNFTIFFIYNFFENWVYQEIAIMHYIIVPLRYNYLNNSIMKQPAPTETGRLLKELYNYIWTDRVQLEILI
jgi:hypothetical protein